MATGLGMFHVLCRTRVKYSGCSETTTLVLRPSRNCNVHALRGGAVKVRSAAARGVGAQRRGLDGAEHSVTISEVMAGRLARGHDVVQIAGLTCGQGRVTTNARPGCKSRSPSARRSLAPDG